MIHECRLKPIAIRHLSDSGDLKRPVMTDKYSTHYFYFVLKMKFYIPTTHLQEDGSSLMNENKIENTNVVMFNTSNHLYFF